MAQLERQWQHGMSRRKALAGLAGVLAGSPLLHAQLDPRSTHRRVLGLNELMTSFDFEPIFFANVPQYIYDYTAHGDQSEFTLRRNRQAFEWVDVVPGTPVDPKSVDLSTEVLGLKLDFPIFVAPTATQVPLHPDGESGMHRGATAARTPMILSAAATLSMEAVAQAATGPMWYQFYPINDLEQSRERLERAQAAGYKAVVVTVDQQASYYERSQHSRNLGGNPNGRGGGGDAGAAGRGGAPARPNPYRINYGRLWYTWDYLDAIHKYVKVPMLIKGILTAEDAELCIQHGMAGVIVSNHGGRALDYSPSTLEVLPEILGAVRGRIPVLTDSGYRRGSDIFKALALGVDAVCLGRATRWALGAYGTPGVQRLLEIMQTELVQTAAAAGRRTRASIDRTAIKVNFS